MATLKLYIDEAEELDFHLLAIHTSLEDFRLAFFLNQKLQLNLSKNTDEIKIKNKEGNTFFSRFTFEDIKNDVFWNLIENENEITLKQNNTNQGLFTESANSFLTKDFLLPEFKKVNFFLKIDASKESINPTEIATLVKSIERVSTVYFINLENIKSKNNLIF
ncbi:MAG: IPExxxVDY family protein [Bacteroidota bacterium]